MHEDPIALVREYVRRDGAGTLHENGWVWGAMTCSELTTTDYLAVVTSYAAEPLSLTSDTARMLVRFAPRFSLGYDSAGTPRLVPDTLVVAETAVVIRTRKRWRISEYPGGAHVYPSTLLSRLPQLGPADRQALEAMSENRLASAPSAGSDSVRAVAAGVLALGGTRPTRWRVLSYVRDSAGVMISLGPPCPRGVTCVGGGGRVRVTANDRAMVLERYR
jgi:hypothetical protein